MIKYLKMGMAVAGFLPEDFKRQDMVSD